MGGSIGDGIGDLIKSLTIVIIEGLTFGIKEGLTCSLILALRRGLKGGFIKEVMESLILIPIGKIIGCLTGGIKRGLKGKVIWEGIFNGEISRRALKLSSF